MFMHGAIARTSVAPSLAKSAARDCIGVALCERDARALAQCACGNIATTRRAARVAARGAAYLAAPEGIGYK
jgi:hypothetical protein